MSNIRQKDLSNYDAIFKLKCIGFNNICTHVEYIHSIFIAHLSTVSNPKNQIMIMIPESGIHGVSLRDAWRRAKWLAVNVTLPSCLTSQRTFFNTRNKQFWVTIMPFYWSVIFSNFLLKYWKKENENTEIILYHQISTLSHTLWNPLVCYVLKQESFHETLRKEVGFIKDHLKCLSVASTCSRPYWNAWVSWMGGVKTKSTGSPILFSPPGDPWLAWLANFLICFTRLGYTVEPHFQTPA